MDAFYFDSSTLVKLYVSEIGSRWMREIFKDATEGTLYTNVLSQVEVISALARRMNRGELSVKTFKETSADVESDFETYLSQVPVTEPLLQAAVGLIQSHRLRSYDEVQLASALLISTALTPITFTFISADIHLNEVASAEGLAVDNPNDHPATDDVNTPPAR
jgi:predicted nucleic acid-binding protein